MARATLVRRIGLLATPEGSSSLRWGTQGRVRKVRDASVLLVDGAVAEVAGDGATPAVPKDLGEVETVDAGGRLATPGLVDCHTHLVFAGWRQREVPLRLRGASYLEILEAGGGILSTVAATRAADEDALHDRALGFLRGMAARGVVAVEAKSGYGLDLETELRQLRVARRLAAESGVDVVSTYLGAHAVPPESKGDADAYVRFVCGTVLPRVAQERLAEFCDVFCEKGAFTAAQSRTVLQAAEALGLRTKVHADELSDSGGALLAAERKAVSAEHLLSTGDAGLSALAAAGTTAVLLPATSLYLDAPFARAREMLARGIPVAVATDFNPGSSPTTDLRLCMTLAYLRYRMTPEEILSAVTLNAACAIGRGDVLGTVEKGKRGGLVLWDADDLEMLVYRLGGDLVGRTVR